MYDDGFDNWLYNQLKNYENRNKAITKCAECKEDLHENEDCYCISGEYYCEECINDSKVTLDEEDFKF